jgi:hypothetical protein
MTWKQNHGNWIQGLEYFVWSQAYGKYKAILGQFVCEMENNNMGAARNILTWC